MKSADMGLIGHSLQIRQRFQMLPSGTALALSGGMKTTEMLLFMSALAVIATGCDSGATSSSAVNAAGSSSLSGSPTPTSSASASPSPSAVPSPTPSPSSSPSPDPSPLVATISCPDTSSEPIQNLTIYNGSGGIWINSGNSNPYLMLGDNPTFTLEYSNISFVYDVTITGSQIIFNSLNEVTPASDCSDGWGPGLLNPFGIVMQHPCAQDLVFTPFTATYSFSCVDSSLGGGLLLNLNLPTGTVSFWTNE